MSDKNLCKKIYEKSLEQLTTLGLQKEKILDIVSIEDYELALRFFEEQLIALPKKEQIRLSETLASRNHYYLNDIFDSLRSYKQNLHFYLNGVPALDTIDTIIFDKVNRDLCLNIKIDGREYGVYAFHRDYPVELKKTALSWTFQVYDISLLNDISFMSKDNVRKNNGMDYAMLYFFHINPQEDLRRIYINPNPNCTAHLDGSCVNCGGCPTAMGTFGPQQANLIQFSIKYKDKDNSCRMYQKHLPTPLDILRCAIHALNCYDAKDVLHRKRDKRAASYRECQVHIAKPAQDKLVMLPLHEYVAEYKASHKSEYKGGHHASPVAHTRRSYFRKSRKRGDYVLQDGEFVYVGNKQGEYSLVSETRVNDKSDKVTIYETPN